MAKVINLQMQVSDIFEDIYESYRLVWIGINKNICPTFDKLKLFLLTMLII